MPMDPEPARNPGAPQAASVTSQRLIPSTADPETEAEMAALCALYDARRQLLADGECESGCDDPDGPLSPQGCAW